MKIKDNFILRKISDAFVVVPIGDAVVDFSGLINLNETGAFLFEKLQDGAEEKDLVNALLKEYNVDENTAKEDVKKFIDKLKDADLVE
ncbi:MAG: PqqD family protein [Ruminococcus sp.]